MVNKRIRGIILTAMVVCGLTLSPIRMIEVQAYPARKVMNVNLNVDANIPGLVQGKDQLGSKIYFGSKGSPLEWHAMSTDSPAVPIEHIYNGSLVYKANLLADDVVKKGNTQAIDYDNESSSWEESGLRTWLNSTDLEDGFIESYFTAKEQEVIKDGITIPSIDEANNWFTSGGNRKVASVKTDTGYPDFWWLRTPGTNNSNSYAAYVTTDGSVDAVGNFVTTASGSARPVFSLNLSNVAFASEKGTDKSAFRITLPSSSNEWVLTLADGNNSFTASRNGTGDVKRGETVSISNISGATTTEGVASTQISAMLESLTDSTIYAYGKIADVSASSADIIIPNSKTIPAGRYILLVFSECVKADSYTSYISNLQDFYFDIVDETSPSITNPQENKFDSGDEQTADSVSQEAYVEPLIWNYVKDNSNSRCTFEHQGPICQMIFTNKAKSIGYTEVFSFNILTRGADNSYHTSSNAKSGKFVLTLPKQFQKPGCKMALIGIDKNGKTKVFYDTDLDDATITIDNLEIEGYAFDVVYQKTSGAEASAQNYTGAATYSVQKGDTLSGIAVKLGTSRKKLLEKNNLDDPNRLKIGQEIKY